MASTTHDLPMLSVEDEDGSASSPSSASASTVSPTPTDLAASGDVGLDSGAGPVTPTNNRHHHQYHQHHHNNSFPHRGYSQHQQHQPQHQPPPHSPTTPGSGSGVSYLHNQQEQHHQLPATVGGSDANAADPKKPRACESCRGLKVRCDPDPADPEGACRRCAKARRSCVVTQPTRKRQKKTDSRVAELEKKIDALTATLQAARSGQFGGGGGGGGGGGLPSPAATTGPMSVGMVGGSAGAAGLATGCGGGSGGGGGGGGGSTSKVGSGWVAAGGAASKSPAAPPPALGVSASAPAPVSAPPLSASSSSSSHRPPPSRLSKTSEAPSRPSSTSAGASASAPSGLPNINPASASDWRPILIDGPTNLATGSTTRVNAYGIVFEKVDDSPPGPMAGQKRKFGADDKDGSSGGGGGGGGSRDRDGYEIPEPPQQIMGPSYKDVVERGVLTAEQAAGLWVRYRDMMCPHLPGVVFPKETTWNDVRQSKPLLFLALMAASSSETPSLQRVLVQELMQIFAEKLVIIGEKSIEVVQALHVAVFWYWPPEHFEELKFYQMIHMAAVLAIDIGLGRKKASVRGKHIPWSWRGEPAFKKQPPPDPCSIESRRTWLTCYFLASNASMTLHRPNLIRWTAFMSECVDVLETSPEAAPTDRYLCHLVWTHHLSEEVGVQFSMDDPTAMIDIADQRTQYAIRGFERDLERYRSSVAPELLQPSLKLGFHVLSLYMHEIALRSSDGPPLDDEPKQPGGDGVAAANGAFRDGTAGIVGSSDEVPLTPAHINALSACLAAIDGIFETFLSMSPESVRCLPVFNFVRVAYATVVLIKMYFAASSPGSELGKVINKDNMKVEQYLDSLLEKFRLTGADNRSRPAAKFHLVLTMLRSWFKKQGQAAAAAAAATAAANASATNVSAGDASNNATAGNEGASDHGYAQTPQQPPTRGDGGSGHQKQQRQKQQPQHQQRQLQQHHHHTTYAASTPLHLLSEIATNDADNGGNPMANMARHNSNNNSNNDGSIPDAGADGRASATPWYGAPQPFMYDNPARHPAPTAPTAGNVVAAAHPSTGATPAGATATAAALPHQQQQWMGNDFDPGSFGDGVVQAMDLTYGGLVAGAAGGGPGAGPAGAGQGTPGMMMYDPQGGFGSVAAMRSFAASEPWFGPILDMGMYQF